MDYLQRATRLTRLLQLTAVSFAASTTAAMNVNIVESESSASATMGKAMAETKCEARP